VAHGVGATKLLVKGSARVLGTHTTGVRDLHAAPRRKLPAPAPSAVDYGTHAVLDEEAARALVELAHAG
jgi:hypothetical protein